MGNAELEAKIINLFAQTLDNYTKLASGKLNEHNTELAIREVSFILDVMGKKRTLEILYFLFINDKIRFNRLRKMVTSEKAALFKRLEIGHISSRTLSQRLKELEKFGIVERKRRTDNPLCVEYSLSAMGREMELPMAMLCWWAIRHNQNISRSSR